VKLKTVEPIRMNITKMASLVLFSRACMSIFKFRVPRNPARISAPNAPMAPPSVGVAQPRKMVPSTRNISTSGGIKAKVTRSVRRENKPSFKRLLINAKVKATKEPTDIDRMNISSRGASPVRFIIGFMRVS